MAEKNRLCGRTTLERARETTIEQVRAGNDPPEVNEFSLSVDNVDKKRTMTQGIKKTAPDRLKLPSDPAD